LNAEAWNRGIRESFSEFLILIEPGDRFEPNALQTLVNAAEQNADAAWIRGAVVFAGPSAESLAPLRGALIRKSAFRRYGLFHTDPFFQGREHQEWIKRLEQSPAAGHQLETVILRAVGAAPNRPNRPLSNGLLIFLKSELDRQRREAGCRQSPESTPDQTA